MAQLPKHVADEFEMLFYRRQAQTIRLASLTAQHEKMEADYQKLKRQPDTEHIERPQELIALADAMWRLETQLDATKASIRALETTTLAGAVIKVISRGKNTAMVVIQCEDARAGGKTSITRHLRRLPNGNYSGVSVSGREQREYALPDTNQMAA